MFLHFSRAAIATALVLCAGPALASQVVGRVVAVADGDTITVLDAERHQHKVRLMGIDAPEKRQAFGTRSREALAVTLFHRDVTVEYKKLDRYGRVIGKVTLGGIDVGLQLVKMGLAWHYVAYAKEQSPEDRAAYSAAEASARSAKRGLWSDPMVVPPWDFRHPHGKQ